MNDGFGLEPAAMVVARFKGGATDSRKIKEVRVSKGDVGDELQIASG